MGTRIPNQPEMVPFRGARVVAGWPKKVRAAQMKTHYTIAGHDYPRVPYGDAEGDDEAAERCHDCAVIKGELHVPSCDMEQCPKCGGQSISCDC